MSTGFKRVFTAFTLTTLLLVSACTAVRNPATGETNYTSLTPEEEIELGRSEDKKVRGEYGGLNDNPALAAYIDRIGQELKAESELPDLEFTFTVLDSSIVNAFALPGGFVYMSRGLLALAENEAEVAGVLGHEIGHVTARHTAQRYDRAVAGQVGTQVAGVIGQVLGAYLGGSAGAQAGGQLAGGLAGVGSQAWVQGFSRSQEFQADELGVRYLTRTNYDPRAMSSFLEALGANDQLQRKLSGNSGGSSVPTWLQSHPRTADRVKRAADEAAGTLSAGGRTERDRYLDAIDGMVYGDSPNQGFIIGKRFAHPKLAFEFTVTDDLRLINTPNAVLGRGETRQMAFEMGRYSGSDFPSYLQNELTKNTKLSDVRPMRVNGREGAVGRVKGSVSGKSVEVMFAVLEGPDQRVYQFQFIKFGSISSEDQNDFERIMVSLKDLNAAETAALKPLRIKVIDVRSGQGVDDFAGMMDVEQLPREHFITLNAFDRNRQLRAGERVKIVVRE